MWWLRRLGGWFPVGVWDALVRFIADGSVLHGAGTSGEPVIAELEEGEVGEATSSWRKVRWISDYRLSTKKANIEKSRNFAPSDYRLPSPPKSDYVMRGPGTRTTRPT